MSKHLRLSNVTQPDFATCSEVNCIYGPFFGSIPSNTGAPKLSKY